MTEALQAPQANGKLGYYDRFSRCSIEGLRFEDPTLVYCPSCGRRLRHNGKRSEHAAKHHAEVRRVRLHRQKGVKP